MSATVNQSVKFSTAQISDVFTLGNQTIQSIKTEASIGATSFKLQGCDTETGTFRDIYIVNPDMTTTLFTFLVDANEGRIYSLSTVFPAGEEFLRIVAEGAVVNGKTITVQGRGV